MDWKIIGNVRFTWIGFWRSKKREHYHKIYSFNNYMGVV